MIKNVFWILSLIIIVIGLSPVQIPKKWNDEIGENFIKGYYYQTTGSDFHIEKETLIADSFEFSKPIHEINLTGNTPAKKFGFAKHYEVMSSDFILKGKIIGVEKLENVGEYYLFEVDKFYLVDYVSIFRNSSIIFKLIFGLSIIVFPVLTIIQLVRIIKR